MATPIYKGSGQPVVSGGWLSGFGSWFGGSSPAYVGESQPVSSGYFGGSTPAYKSAPSDGGTQSRIAPSSQPERITIMVPRELIESQQ